MSYVGAIQQFGLINDTPSPAVRVYTDQVSDDSEATIRDVTDTETDPEGQIIFSSYLSELTISAVDVQGQGTVSGWMDSRTMVKAVVEVPEAVIMWTSATRITTRSGYTPTEPGLQKAEYILRRDSGDKDTHGVLLTRNVLAPFDTTGAVSETFVYPLDGSDLTLSADFAANGGTVTVEAQDASGTALQSGSTTSNSSGRISATLTTPSNTHFLDVSVSGDTPQKPALRVDGSTQYVAR